MQINQKIKLTIEADAGQRLISRISNVLLRPNLDILHFQFEKIEEHSSLFEIILNVSNDDFNRIVLQMEKQVDVKKVSYKESK
ncbi:hypothetical protein FEE95_14140 [Maribacter algarum]|uniref:ACT domain-containing protein n=1 Tax=Maribacter algarum (ex Zhang et al. 2020) TaxID=2578118 RepID=A0A5S3PMS6_9FLAO|nr:hypothetical protein [Maribacter algarum]TMM55793.1 hypothetical protein FEE95_14140 [Maribacter algarum]